MEELLQAIKEAEQEAKTLSSNIKQARSITDQDRNNSQALEEEQQQRFYDLNKPNLRKAPQISFSKEQRFEDPFLSKLKDEGDPKQPQKLSYKEIKEHKAKEREQKKLAIMKELIYEKEQQKFNNFKKVKGVPVYKVTMIDEANKINQDSQNDILTSQSVDAPSIPDLSDIRDKRVILLAEKRKKEQIELETRPDLNVNHDFTKKRATTAVIKPSVKDQIRKERLQYLQQRDSGADELSQSEGGYTVDTAITDIYAEDPLRDLPGPGQYNPDIKAISKNVRGGKFGQDKRNLIKKDEKAKNSNKDGGPIQDFDQTHFQTPLQINDQMIRKNNKTGVKIMPDTKKDKRVQKLERRAKEEEKRLKQLEFAKFKQKFLEEQRKFRAQFIREDKENKEEGAVSSSQVNLENGSYNKQGGVNQPDQRSRMAKIFLLMDQLSAMRRGPGYYEDQTSKIRSKDDMCMIHYDKQIKNIREKESNQAIIEKELTEQKLGPGYYLSKDDMIRPKAQAAFFATDVLDEKERQLKNPLKTDLDLLDRRQALDLNFNQIDKKAPGVVIKQDTTQDIPYIMKTIYDRIEQEKLGPGTYSVNHKIDEKRVDIGNVQYLKVDDPLKFRENQLEHLKHVKDANDPVLNIQYQRFEKQPPQTVIKDKLDPKLPPNIPDKFFKQERWEFHDKDYDLIREKVGKDLTFAGKGITFTKFKLQEKEKEMLRAYLSIQHKQPDLGHYDPLFDQLEKGVVGVPDFQRYLQRSRLLTREELMQKDVAGDVLVLDPERPKPRLPDIKLDKYTGRYDQDDFRVKDLNEEVVLDLKYDQFEKKQPVLVDMERQQSRADWLGIKKEKFEPQQNNLEAENFLDVNYNMIEKKTNALTDYQRDTGRKGILDKIDKMNQLNDSVMLEPNQEFGKEKPKMLVNMTRPKVDIRIKQGKQIKLKGKDQDSRGQRNSATQDLMKGVNFTKPNTQTNMNFGGYSTRK